MCDLVIRSDLAPQIGRLREQLTEDINIIRWGNGLYRRCRQGDQVDLSVADPSNGVRPNLKMRPSDL